MGAPSGESLRWPVALISASPGPRALIELRSIQASPDEEISKSSLPTGWPLTVMRNFPLSAENTDGAPAGVGVPGVEEGAKTRRLNRLRKKEFILSFRAKRGISPSLVGFKSGRGSSL